MSKIKENSAKPAGFMERLKALKPGQRQMIVYFLIAVLAAPFLFFLAGNFKRNMEQLNKAPVFKSMVGFDDQGLEQSANNLRQTSQELDQQMRILDQLDKMSTSELESLLNSTSSELDLEATSSPASSSQARDNF